VVASDSVQDLFDGRPLPSRDEYVLAQGFLVDPAYCKKVLPDERMWPAELDHLPEHANGRIRIDRALLFAIAQRAITELDNPWSATQLHAAITFWGAPAGLSRKRAVKPLADVNVSARLSEAIKVVRGAGPASAYKALSRYQRLWISGLGPSYFTKLMYYAGYGAKPYMSQPLIMDDNVVAGLIKVTGQQWEASVDDYVRYLDLAKDWAYEFGTEPDVIERRLFAIGS
jgi:hypothetical protein